MQNHSTINFNDHNNLADKNKPLQFNLTSSGANQSLDHQVRTSLLTNLLNQTMTQIWQNHFDKIIQFKLICA